jgi:hypothetical protein
MNLFESVRRATMPELFKIFVFMVLLHAAKILVYAGIMAGLFWLGLWILRSA